MVNEDPVVGASGAIAITIQGVAVAGHLIGGYLEKQFANLCIGERRKAGNGGLRDGENKSHRLSERTRTASENVPSSIFRKWRKKGFPLAWCLFH